MAKRTQSTIRTPTSRETSFFKQPVEASLRRVQEWSAHEIENDTGDPAEFSIRTLQNFILASRQLPIVPITCTGEVITGWESDLATRWALAALVSDPPQDRLTEVVQSALYAPGLWPNDLLPHLGVTLHPHTLPVEINPYAMLIWPLRPVTTTSPQIMAEEHWQATVAVPTLSTVDVDSLRRLTSRHGPELVAAWQAMHTLPDTCHELYIDQLLPIWATYQEIPIHVLLLLHRLSQTAPYADTLQGALALLSEPQTISVTINLALQNR